MGWSKRRLHHRRWLAGSVAALSAGFLAVVISQAFSLGTTSLLALWVGCVLAAGGVLAAWSSRPRRRGLRIDIDVGGTSSFQTLKIWQGNDVIMSLESDPPEAKAKASAGATSEMLR